MKTRSDQWHSKNDRLLKTRLTGRNAYEYPNFRGIKLVFYGLYIHAPYESHLKDRTFQER
jgi:hypothetical protein